MAQPRKEANRQTVMDPMLINDCAAAVIGTGQRARDLLELRYQLLTIHPGCIYYHFWGARLQPRFDNPDYVNDFAQWAHDALHDVRLAERLGVLDPLDFPSLDALRQGVLEVIDERLDESNVTPDAAPDGQFHFIRSQLVILGTQRSASTPQELGALIAHLSPGSVFYHFIDARRRTETGEDDFRVWLRRFGDAHAGLIEAIGRINPYFVSLLGLREQLAAVFEEYGRKAQA
jgi:hypothetical protein